MAAAWFRGGAGPAVPRPRLTAAMQLPGDPPRVLPDCTYLVTGGLGALGLRVAREPGGVDEQLAVRAQRERRPVDDQLAPVGGEDVAARRLGDDGPQPVRVGELREAVAAFTNVYTQRDREAAVQAARKLRDSAVVNDPAGDEVEAIARGILAHLHDEAEQRHAFNMERVDAPRDVRILRTELETKENSDGRANGDSVRWVDAGDRGSDLVGPDARG
jgi:hypothetical protein